MACNHVVGQRAFQCMIRSNKLSKRHSVAPRPFTSQKQSPWRLSPSLSSRCSSLGPSSSSINLTINPWTILLDDCYLSTRITSRTCRDVEKTVLILFHSEDACLDYRRVMMENYERSGGVWTTNCVTHVMYANKGMLVLESTSPMECGSFDEPCENVPLEIDSLCNLRCVEMDIYDEMNIHDLNLITPVVYFIVTSFENDAATRTITLHGMFSKLRSGGSGGGVGRSLGEFGGMATSDAMKMNSRQEYLVNFMNRIYHRY